MTIRLNITFRLLTILMKVVVLEEKVKVIRKNQVNP
jgi:hypothetical protein